MHSRVERASAACVVAAASRDHATPPRLRWYTAASSMQDTLPSRARRAAGWLLGPALPPLAALLAVALSLPSLSLGLVADDYVHQQHFMVDGARAHPRAAWYDMFGVPGGGADEVDEAVRAGVLPWWTPREYTFALFRPFSAATHYLDYSLWPDHPTLMHAQNLLWYAILVWAVGVLYRRILGVPRIAALATLAYAVRAQQADGVAWLAGRNTLVTATWAMLALVAHDRSRRDAWKLGPWLTPLAVGLALASSEGGVALFGYLLAYALFIDRAPIWQRVKALLPALGVLIGWQLWYRSMGYGTKAGGVYLDPLTQPWRFAQRLPVRLGSLLRDLVSLPENAFRLVPEQLVGPSHWLALALAVLIAAALPLLLLRRPRTAFWLVSTLLASLPFCATEPMARLLFLPAVGGCALLGELVDWSLSASRRGAGARAFCGGLGVLIALVHGPFAAFASARTAAALTDFSLSARLLATTLPSGPGTADASVFVLNTPNCIFTLLTIISYDPATIHPTAFRILGSSLTPVHVKRTAPRVLVLEAEGGYLLEPSSWLTRSPDNPFRRGQRVDIDLATIVVQDITADGRPLRVRIELKAEDPSRTFWVAWPGPPLGYQRIELPPPGGEIVLRTLPTAL